jgi:hypothetical protein
MKFEEVTPDKLLNFLKAHAENLLKELDGVRDRFYNSVENGNTIAAADDFKIMVQLQRELVAAVTEYSAGREYVAQQEALAEAIKDLPKN